MQTRVGIWAEIILIKYCTKVIPSFFKEWLGNSTLVVMMEDDGSCLVTLSSGQLSC